MIWKGPEHPAPERNALLRHLQSEVASASTDPAFAFHYAGEVARGIEAYCREVLSDTTIPSGYLAALVSRALWGIGEADAAMNAADALPEAMGQVASLRCMTPAAWRVFESRLVRPSRWLVGGEDLVWTLDLSRLRWERRVCVEMSFLRALKAVIEGIAEVWDASGGKGTLGLKGVGRAARSVLGAGVSKKKAAHFAVEIRAFCEGLLLNLRHRRGWAEAPGMLDLDPVSVISATRGRRRR